MPLDPGVLYNIMWVCQWLATGQWFSPGPNVSSTNKTDRHDMAFVCSTCGKAYSTDLSQVTDKLTWCCTPRPDQVFELTTSVVIGIVTQFRRKLCLFLRYLTSDTNYLSPNVYINILSPSRLKILFILLSQKKIDLLILQMWNTSPQWHAFGSWCVSLCRAKFWLVEYAFPQVQNNFFNNLVRNIDVTLFSVFRVSIF
jgi:hypothetical protein